MTISSSATRRIRVVMDGVGTTVEVTFPFYANTDLQVYKTTAAGVESTLALTTDYTVSGGSGSTGTVTLTAVHISGTIITITSNVPTLQSLDLVKDNALNPTALETALDKLAVIVQDREERINRAILSTAASGISDIVIGDKVANQLLAWNAAATQITSVDPTTLTINVTTNPVSGSELAVTQSAHGLSVGNVIYHNGTGYAKAKADATSTAEVVGVVISVASVSSFTFVTSGHVTFASAHGLTLGANAFLSAATAGLLTNTEPTASTNISIPCFIATSTTGGIVRIQRGIQYA